MASEQQKRNIVIIGGGIIGSTTAYFLSHHPHFNPSRGDTITLLEATKIAGGASGKAGGLLALWAYPSCIVPLSYRLHRELAEKYGGAERWGYRGVGCGQVDAYGLLKKDGGGNSSVGDGNGKREAKSEIDGQDAVSLQKRSEKAIGLLRAAGVPKELDWIAAEGLKSYEEMGTPDTTAQVHPYLFTTSMAELAVEKGVKIVYGSATSINKSSSGAVESVTYTPKDSSSSSSDDEIILQANTIILTTGPWTKTLLPQAPISALRAHSITIRPSRPVSAFALFTSIDLPASNNSRHTTNVTPEIYARPNNEVYACGSGDTLTPLPPSTSLVECDPSACDEIYAHVSSISGELRDGTVTARQACYLPNVEGRHQGPIIGETSVKGLFIGSGHTCWGIQNGPGTGKCLSELVWEGRVRSAKIGALEPGRFGL